ncbi:hypothetical protein HDV63DRAFT_373946 [Trichoderma sp. SZMC 28014]
MLHRIIARICFSCAWAFSHFNAAKRQKENSKAVCQAAWPRVNILPPSFGNPSRGSISNPLPPCFLSRNCLPGVKQY